MKHSNRSYNYIFQLIILILCITAVHSQTVLRAGRRTDTTVGFSQECNGVIPSPAVYPEECEFVKSLTVSMAIPCTTSDCKNVSIHYTLDGSDPQTSSTAAMYETPITIDRSLTLKAYVSTHDSCRRQSSVVEKRYIRLQYLPTPLIVPESPYFTLGQAIALMVPMFENDTDVAIYYTVNGQDPSRYGKRYNEPLLLDNSGTIRAVAISLTGSYLNSPQYTKNVILKTPVLPQPVITPPSTNFSDSLLITITVPGLEHNKEIILYYTTNGTDPLSYGMRYLGEFTITSTAAVNAVAVCAGYQKSAVAREYFSKGIQKVMPKAIITPSGGIYSERIPPVSLSCTVDNAMILYTLDGSEPKLGCTLYDGKPLELVAPALLKVKVFKGNRIPSVTITEKYDYQQLPKPQSNVVSGTSFSSELSVALHVPGFDPDSIAVLYTLDGKTPNESSTVYTEPLSFDQSCMIKAMAVKKGYYSSEVSTFEYFNMLKVINACYTDINGDGFVETAVLHFNQPLQQCPSVIEFTDPFNGTRKGAGDYTITMDTYQKNKIVVHFHKPLSARKAFAAGHYGRIPLPGEYHTAPFLIYYHDADDLDNQQENRFVDITAITNPFVPGESKIPDFIQELDDYRTTTGTAIMVKPMHPSFAYANIYDGLGNKIVSQKPLVEDLEKTGTLYLLWDGTNSSGYYVASGTYLAVITLNEKQSGISVTKSTRVSVQKK